MKDIPTSNPKSDSRNLLAIGRTILANERTLLAFLRTALCFFLGGIAMIKYWEHPVIVGLGFLFIVLAPLLLVWGLFRYSHAKKALKLVTPGDQIPIEKEIGL